MREKENSLKLDFMPHVHETWKEDFTAIKLNNNIFISYCFS